MERLSFFKNLVDGLSGEVVFLMSLGGLIEEFTVKKTRSGIEKLTKLVPKTATVVTETVKTSIPTIAATTVSLPTTTEGKIRYFQTLLATGVITPEQFKKYTNTVFTTDFPSLYTK